MKKKAKTKKKPSVRVDLHAWVTPFGGAKYWEGMIGEVFSITKKDADVRFHYKRDGTRLKTPEEFRFPVARLKVVPDFRARVIKHASNAPSQGQADVVEKEFTYLEAEDYNPPPEPAH